MNICTLCHRPTKTAYWISFGNDLHISSPVCIPCQYKRINKPWRFKRFIQIITFHFKKS
jgi:hypothetical protein